MLSYKNDPHLKAKAVKRAKFHRDQDLLIAGTYGEFGGGNFRGCSVGCDAYDITGNVGNYGPHRVTADYYGLPLWLERLRDTLFEGLPAPDRYDFHLQYKEAIPVGVDLNHVHHQLAIRRLDRLIALLEGISTLDTRSEVAALLLAKRAHEGVLVGAPCDWDALKSILDAVARAARDPCLRYPVQSAIASSGTPSEDVTRGIWFAAEAAGEAAWLEPPAGPLVSRATTAPAAHRQGAYRQKAYQQERDDLLELLAGAAGMES